jgi:hypothetical protein
MAAAGLRRNLCVSFSTTLTIAVNMSASVPYAGELASFVQASHATMKEQRGAGWSIPAPGFGRADVG